MEMKWWNKMMVPMRKVWAKVSKRITRKTGIIKLHQDVRTCEYEDVHILWDMLKKNNETDEPKRGRDHEQSDSWKFHWAKCLLCFAVVFDMFDPL